MKHQRLQPLSWRLALMMVGVALVVTGMFAVALFLSARSDLTPLTAKRAAQIETSISQVAARAYQATNSWEHADLKGVLKVATEDGVRISILNNQGKVLAQGGARIAGKPAPVQLIAIQSDRSIVGDFRLTFPGTYTETWATVDRRLLAAAGIIGALSVLLGLIVALVIARRVTRPLRTLAATVASVNEGNTDARVGHVSSVDELQSLAEGFDTLADTLQRQDELRRAMVADVAHELRNPVAVLQAACEAMVEGVAEPTAGLAASMLEEVRRIGRRIADLDALAAAESAHFRMTRERVDLAQVALDATVSARQVLRDAGVAVSTSLVRSVVLGDRDRLHQVVSNLLLNAAKHTPFGGEVLVSVRPEGSNAVLRVSDTGVGIPPDELPHVFERFWRGRHASVTHGSGVGLAIVAELVRAHRGEVEVASTVGMGTEFTVRIPLAAPRQRGWSPDPPVQLDDATAPVASLSS